MRDVSFDVERGEILGLFGPSGAGKTAILDSLRGTSKVAMGSIFLDGRDITTTNRNGSVDAAEFADGSIWDRLFKKDDGRLRSLHRAIASAKNVLLLDEVFCGLDQGSREEAVAKLRSAVSEKNLSVIFASNDYERILDVCDRAAVIVRGEILQVGTPHDIYEKPASRVVADITGRNNLFAARRLTSSKVEMPEFHTIDGGHRLFAQRIERGSLGALNQNVTLAIRPEHISISFGASFPEDNLLKATVTRVRFLGPTTLIELDADGLKLEALVLRLVGLDVGDECMVGLPPDRILILKD